MNPKKKTRFGKNIVITMTVIYTTCQKELEIAQTHIMNNPSDCFVWSQVDWLRNQLKKKKELIDQEIHRAQLGTINIFKQ